MIQSLPAGNELVGPDFFRAMARAAWLWGLGLFAGAVAFSRRTFSTPGTSTPATDDRAFIVVGDSYGVGIAAALDAMFPNRAVGNDAEVGRFASDMDPIEDREAVWIVSAGTNDAAGGASIESIASQIVRVLGPYADGTATKGVAVYVEPHDKMGGVLGARVRELVQELQPRLLGKPRLRIIMIRPEPVATDGIHFNGAGYRMIASDAAAAGAAVPASSSSGSKSGLLPDGTMDPAFKARAIEVAQEAGIPLSWLLAVMWFESQFRSDIRNPHSKAGGLIQWAPSIWGKGFVDEITQKSAVAQLDDVAGYYERFGSFANRDPRDAYLAVFSPAMMGKPDSERFYLAPSKAYEQNRGLDRDKDGAITVGEVRRTIEGAHAHVLAKGWAA